MTHCLTFTRRLRTIAFRKTSNGYRWISDQETFQGPKEYKTVDGTVREQLTFT